MIKKSERFLSVSDLQSLKTVLSEAISQEEYFERALKEDITYTKSGGFDDYDYFVDVDQRLKENRTLLNKTKKKLQQLRTLQCKVKGKLSCLIQMERWVKDQEKYYLKSDPKDMKMPDGWSDMVNEWTE